MSGYCPAGKCECEKLVIVEVFGGSREACKAVNPAGDISATKYEVCPWPSRQVRLEPPVEQETEMDKRLGRINDRAYDYGYDRGHAAGRLAGLQEAREGVEQLAETHPDINVSADNGWVKLSVILAAIDRLMGGK